MSVVEIPLTRGKVALLDAWHAPFFQQWAWNAYQSASGTWYARTNWKQLNDGYKCVTMHSVISMLRGWEAADHISGNGLDNRLENLRRATHKQNMENRRLHPRNKFGCPGISPRPHGKFAVTIGHNNHSIHLGVFDTLEEAIQARRDGEMQFHTHYPEEYRT